jgi:GT2 family glycosyltransferase
VKIVVVDTTPNDPELEAALNFAPDTTILRAAENLGFGKGNNLGIRWAVQHSGCELFFFLNNDAVVEPNSVETLERAMSIQGEVGIMVPRIAYLDEPEMLWYGGGEVDWRRASAYTPGIGHSAVAELAMTERDVTFATGCALFVRRSVIRLIGGFDPRYFMYEEDVELCVRASKNGVRIRYLPASKILHRVQGSNRKSNESCPGFWTTTNPRLSFYTFHVIRNRLLTVYLHARGRNLLIVTVFFPLFLIRRAVPFIWGNRLDAVIAMFKGVVDSWRSIRAKAPVATEIREDGIARQ